MSTLIDRLCKITMWGKRCQSCGFLFEDHSNVKERCPYPYVTTFTDAALNFDSMTTRGDKLIAHSLGVKL